MRNKNIDVFIYKLGTITMAEYGWKKSRGIKLLTDLLFFRKQQLRISVNIFGTPCTTRVGIKQFKNHINRT